MTDEERIEATAKAWHDAELHEGAWDDWRTWRDNTEEQHEAYRQRARAALIATGIIEPPVVPPTEPGWYEYVTSPAALTKIATSARAGGCTCLTAGSGDWLEARRHTRLVPEGSERRAALEEAMRWIDENIGGVFQSNSFYRHFGLNEKAGE